MQAEGDGSTFAATRGFDFDLASYARRPALKGLSEAELRLAAIDQLIRHPAVEEIVDGDEAPRRESVETLLQRLTAHGADSARQVDRFRHRLPRAAESVPRAAAGDALTFTAPDQIAAFGQDEPLTALDGCSLGAAVLSLTGWSAIRTL